MPVTLRSGRRVLGDIVNRRACPDGDGKLGKKAVRARPRFAFRRAPNVTRLTIILCRAQKLSHGPEDGHAPEAEDMETWVRVDPRSAPPLARPTECLARARAPPARAADRCERGGARV